MGPVAVRSDTMAGLGLWIGRAGLPVCPACGGVAGNHVDRCRYGQGAGVGVLDADEDDGGIGEGHEEQFGSER